MFVNILRQSANSLDQSSAMSHPILLMQQMHTIDIPISRSIYLCNCLRLGPAERERLTDNIAGALVDAQEFLQKVDRPTDPTQPDPSSPLLFFYLRLY